MQLTEIDYVAAMRDCLSGYFDSIEIILYLRPQVDLAISMASTASLLGIVINSEWFVGQSQNPMFDFDALASRWEAIFGAENLSIYPYNSAPIFFNVVWDRFLRGIPAPDVNRNSNESLTVDAIALNNRLRISTIHPKLGKDLQVDLAFRALRGGQRLSLGVQRAEAFQQMFDRSNVRLCNRRSDIKIDDLCFSPARHKAPSNIGILDSGQFDPKVHKAFKRAFAKLAPAGHFRIQTGTKPVTPIMLVSAHLRPFCTQPRSAPRPHR